MTVARDGVIVEKRLDVQSMPLPAVSFDIVSDRDRPVEVTLVEQLPADVDVDRLGFHPGFGAEGWSCYDGGELVWRGRLAPGEHVQTVFGVWLDSPDRARSLLTSPSVEAIRAVADDTEPRVLDESFVARPDAGDTALKTAVEATVPDEALRGEGGLPRWSDLPDAGADLTAPSRAAVDEVVAAVTNATDVTAHDRYYHLRLSVETAGRGDREVSLLEDLTNALSVLYADADDRDDGAWRVLDVVIGTNWQAERIVTALGDDHRVAGLLVTELTGAVESGVSTGNPRPEPRPPDESGTAPADDELASTVLFGHVSEPEGADESDEPAESVDVPAETSDLASDDDAGGFEFADPVEPESEAEDDEVEAALAEVDPDEEAGETATDDGFGGFEPASVESADDAGDGSSTVATDEPAEDEPGPVEGETDDHPQDSMATFAELKAETEQASVDDLDEELEEMVLSPDEEEEYSIADLLEDFDEEGDTVSAA
ncbi:hypothetical protein [Haloarchaeobius amylolyticus]|uniref:hypothetical protein n=1 Tax=Haloarchaeobius amylolyticus TaxID=1198296 RepID=UPI00226F09BB|nr:hypothetical protein [Haloarchaeobius amylolyticus]